MDMNSVILYFSFCLTLICLNGTQDMMVRAYYYHPIPQELWPDSPEEFWEKRLEKLNFLNKEERKMAGGESYV